jgi:hypothetical protein
MKTHIINRFIAITAVAWLGQAGAETGTSQRLSHINHNASSPAASPQTEHPAPQPALTPSNDRQHSVITVHRKSHRT